MWYELNMKIIMIKKYTYLTIEIKSICFFFKQGHFYPKITQQQYSFFRF